MKKRCQAEMKLVWKFRIFRIDKNSHNILSPGKISFFKEMPEFDTFEEAEQWLLIDCHFEDDNMLDWEYTILPIYRFKRI